MPASYRPIRAMVGPIYVITPVFFNLLAAAEPYVNVMIIHGTPCIYAIIRKSSDIAEVEFSGRLGTDVPSGVERQKTCEVFEGKTLKRCR